MVKILTSLLPGARFDDRAARVDALIAEVLEERAVSARPDAGQLVASNGGVVDIKDHGR